MLLRAIYPGVFSGRPIISCSPAVIGAQQCLVKHTVLVRKQWLLLCAGVLPRRREEAVPAELYGSNDKHWRQGQPGQLLADLLPARPAGGSGSIYADQIGLMNSLLPGKYQPVTLPLFIQVTTAHAETCAQCEVQMPAREDMSSSRPPQQPYVRCPGSTCAHLLTALCWL